MEFLRQVMIMVLSFAYLKPAEAVRRNCQVEIANTVNGFSRYHTATNAISEPSLQKNLDFSTPLRSALECINAGKTLASHHKLTQLEDHNQCGFCDIFPAIAYQFCPKDGSVLSQS